MTLRRIINSVLATAALGTAGVGAATLPEVLVSAARFTTEGYNTPAPISVIRRAEIEASGAANLAELLTNRAGIQLQSFIGDGSLTAIGMRGFGANAVSNTLVLLDGRRLNNPDIDPPDLTLIALDSVERVEIIQGSAGALFGDNAVGGVINIVTRHAGPSGQGARAAVGSFDSYRVTVRTALQPGADTGLHAAASHGAADNYRRSNRGERSAATLGLRHGPWLADLQMQDERQELAGALTAAQRDADPRQAQFPGDFTAGRSLLLRLAYHEDMGADWRLALDGSVRTVDTEGLLTGLDFTQERELFAFNPRVNGYLGDDRVFTEITAGADLEYSRYRLVTPAIGFQRNRQTMLAAYLQATTTLDDTLGLTVGARHARVANAIRDTFTFPAGGNLDDAVNVFTLGATWRVSDSLRLFARRDGNFRFAKVDEQLDSNTGSSGLRTQTGVSWEAGADWYGTAGDARIMAFVLDLEDEIDTHPSASLFGPFPANTNLEPTRRSGVLVQGSLHLADDLDLRAHHTMTSARFRNGAFAGNTIPGVARHQSGATLDWRPRAGWLVRPGIRHLSAQYAGGDYANRLERLDARTLLDLYLRHERGPWRLGVRVANLLDTRYDLLAVRQSFPTEESTFYPAPGRTFMLTLEYRGDGGKP